MATIHQPLPIHDPDDVSASHEMTAERPRVQITYCPRCRWLLRAAWMAQELLITFERDLGEVALRPGDKGQFEVRLNGVVIWSRAEEGRFPELKELKQRVRDRVVPDRALGHSDRPAAAAPPDQ